MYLSLWPSRFFEATYGAVVDSLISFLLYMLASWGKANMPNWCPSGVLSFLFSVSCMNTIQKKQL